MSMSIEPVDFDRSPMIVPIIPGHERVAARARALYEVLTDSQFIILPIAIFMTASRLVKECTLV